MTNELRSDFEDILQDTAVEYEIELPKGFVAELYTQLSHLFGDCQDNFEEE